MKKAIAEETPFSTTSDTFCDNKDIFLFYDHGDSAVVVAFRSLVTNPNEHIYLGRREIAKSPSWSDKKIIR